MRYRILLSAATSLGLLATSSSAGETIDHKTAFPREIVAWEPITANPLFQGTGGEAWDANIRERGWILRSGDGTYRLWYTGYNKKRSNTIFLGHATSPDGIHWTRDPRNPIFKDLWTEDICVVHRDGTYYMFAEGLHDIAHLLTSPDGIHWQEQGPLDVRLVDGAPIPPGPYGTPTVIVVDDVWYLFYERRDRGIWLATSTDRRVWTNVQDKPVIASGPEPYDAMGVALNDVIKFEGAYYGLYHANATPAPGDWTTCIARSTDLIHWEKYPKNPIVENNSSSGIFVETPDGFVLYTMHPVIRRYQHLNETGEDEQPDAP